MDQKKKAYVTLITSDAYLNGALVLIKTLRKTTNIDVAIIVLVTPNVSKSTIGRLSSIQNIQIRVVEPINRPHESSIERCWDNAQYSKLHIWNQTDFDIIVYIDADCIILECIEELFELTSNNCQVFAASPDVFPPDKFNAGVLVITPSSIMFELLCEATKHLPSYDFGDTGFLNAFFHMWYNVESVDFRSLRLVLEEKYLNSNPQSLRFSASDPDENKTIKLIKLPFGYNAQRTMYHFTKANPKYWESIQPLKIVHYSSSPKPWDDGLDSKFIGPLEKVWWETFLM